MTVTRALLTAVFIDLVNSEKAATDEWISTKAIKALIEYRYNLQGLKMRMVTMAIKLAVDQHKDEYWMCNNYRGEWYVWAVRELLPQVLERVLLGKDGNPVMWEGVEWQMAKTTFDWSKLPFDYSSQLIDQPEAFVQSYHDRLAERETIVRGSITRRGRKSAIFKAQPTS